MNRHYKIAYFLFLILLLLLFPSSVYAVNNTKKKNLKSFQSIKAYNNEGSTSLYGSVLDPNINQVFLLLPKQLLNIVRKMGTAKVAINFTSTIDSTKSFTVPSDAIKIQNEKINKKTDKYLVINLYNLNTQSGVLLTPNAIPSDNYKLRIASSDFEATSDTIRYETPTLIVGTIDSSKPGLVTVEDLNGNILSEKTVVTNNNGTFFTEVRANKIPADSITKNLTKSKLFQNNSAVENKSGGIETGVVHVVADKDLLTLVSLNNDVESNTEKANNPLQVNESTTLTANLARGYSKLATEVVKEQEEGKIEATKSNDFGCDILQFADKCSANDKEALTSVGKMFKEFVSTSECTFPEFKLLKEVVSSAPDDINFSIGKGYCEYINREEDPDKACEEYSKLLSNIKSSPSAKLPCPPSFCTEFQNIKPPRCFIPTNFCENKTEITDTSRNIRNNSCIEKPKKELFCAQIGVDIDESECTSSSEINNSNINFTVITNSKGNTYCVPAGFNSNNNQNFQPPEKIAEDCEVFACHSKCEVDFGSKINFTPASSTELEKCDVCDCHIKCDEDAGRIIDCYDQKSRFYSIKCCNKNVFNPISFSGIQFNGASGFGLGQGPIQNDIRNCLCENPDNFKENGLVKEEAQLACKNNCSDGFEYDEEKDLCLPLCDKGLVRDPSGFCKRKCPPGFVENAIGSCSCPEGQIITDSGKCGVPFCPESCKSIPFVRTFLEHHDGTGFLPPATSTNTPFVNTGFPPTTFSGSSSPSSFPPECRQCFDIGISGQSGACPRGERKDPFTGLCPGANCGIDQYLDGNGTCRCNFDGSVATSTGPDGCRRQNNCGGNMLPNNVPGEAQCICPAGLPYWDNTRCVAQCPNGQPSANTSTNLPPKSPIPCNYTMPGQCPSSYPFYHNGACLSTCPPPLVPGSITGTGNAQCLCPGNIPPNASGECSSSQRYCVAGEIPSQNNCTCASPGYTSGSGTACQCPPGYSIAYSAQGCGSTLRYCAAGEAQTSLVCTCAPGASNTGPNGICQCTNGQTYTANGCSSTNYQCGSNMLPNSTPGEAGCICPSGLPYWYQPSSSSIGSCVATCPNGSPPANASTGLPPRSPIPCSSSRPCTAGEGPSNGCYCFGNGYVGSDGKCQCTGGVQYTGGGCGSTGSNYCVAGTGPTSSNPCTCAGSATVINGTCQCPNNNPAYTAAGCGSSTTQNCPAPYTTNPAYNSSNPGGVPPCICPSGKYYYNNDCVATCPNSLATGTPSSGCGAGPIPSCLCPGTLQCPGSNGQCSSTTSSHTCVLGEVSNSSNPCTCASGATVGSNGQCQCTNGQVYASGGCPTSTTSSHTCVLGEVSNSSNPCTCASGATVGSNGQCQCTNGQVYASGGCPTATTRTCGAGEGPNISSSNPCTCESRGGTTVNAAGYCTCPSSAISYTAIGCRVCSVNEVYSSSNSCQCAGTATYNSQNICSCPSGGTYSESGCTAPPTITLTSATISGSNVTISFSVDPNTCLLVKDASNNTLKSANLCGVGSFNSVFPTSDFTPALVSGTQVKLCDQNNSNNCSNLVTIP